MTQGDATIPAPSPAPPGAPGTPGSPTGPPRPPAVLPVQDPSLVVVARRRLPGPGAFAFAALVATLIALTLQFAAAGKLLGPNPKEVLLAAGETMPLTALTLKQPVLFDHAIAAGEMVVVVLLLTLRRHWWSWPWVALMFGCFLGWALCAHLRGVPCGCFAKLWTPPALVTLYIDLGFVSGAIIAMLALRARAWAVIATIVLVPLVGYAGYRYADTHLPPPPTTTVGRTAPEILLASPLMADIVAQAPGGPQWYIFVYDPQCSVCESMKPVVEMFQQQYDAGNDTTLRIREFSIPDLVTKLNIRDSEWAPTPTVLLVKDGKIVRKWNGEDSPYPDQEFQMKVGSGQFAAGL